MENTDNIPNKMFSNKDLAKLIIPLIIEQMLTVTVGLADSIMTSSVGEEAVSGVSLVDSVMVLMINLFSALATGGAVVAGQFLGQRKNVMACKTADPADIIYYFIICGNYGRNLCVQKFYPECCFWKYRTRSYA